MTLEAGQQLLHYRLIQKIGEGRLRVLDGVSGVEAGGAVDRTSARSNGSPN
jgi:hypothetical protein